jgi:TetR/AcrR family transcriptional regulator, regulator of cefoperazone and chloramphenicol sensitivity
MPSTRAVVASAKRVRDDGRRRRPAAGGYARGDETRSRIIAAALEVFGTNGFGGASTRMIAEKAGVTLPALHYYFDSKEGAYLACAEHIAERMQANLGAATARIAEMLANEKPSSSQLLETLLGFLDRLTDLFLGAHELDNWLLFIIREQAHPTKAFDILFKRMMSRVAGACAMLVARLLDKPDSDPEVRIRTVALVGQIIFFRTAREAALRIVGWPDFDGDRLALVKHVLHAQTIASFGPSLKSSLNPKRRRTA